MITKLSAKSYPLKAYFSCIFHHWKRSILRCRPGLSSLWRYWAWLEQLGYLKRCSPKIWWYFHKTLSLCLCCLGKIFSWRPDSSWILLSQRCFLLRSESTNLLSTIFQPNSEWIGNLKSRNKSRLLFWTHHIVMHNFLWKCSL